MTITHESVWKTTLDVWIAAWNAYPMTTTKKLFGRRNGRHALRSSATVAAILGSHHDETTAFEARARRGSAATRNVLAHTSHEWYSLRHAV